MSFVLDHDKKRGLESARAQYHVTPKGREDTSGLEPVTFTVSTGVANVQDYLTPEQAEELAAALLAGAEAARALEAAK